MSSERNVMEYRGFILKRSGHTIDIIRNGQFVKQVAHSSKFSAAKDRVDRLIKEENDAARRVFCR